MTTTPERGVEEWEKEFDRAYIAGELEIDVESKNNIPFKKLKSFIHHQLQKAREEVVIETVNAIKDSIPFTLDKRILVRMQEVIDKYRYHSELDQDTCCKKYNGTLDITNSCIFCKTYLGAELNQAVSK